ncbi:MAG: ASCH domain-containing protein [Luteimonas sp.]
MVTDWSGTAICIIRTIEVQVVPLNEITESHARIEGEGDGSLAWWLKAHWDYYHHELQGTGRVPGPDMPIVFQEFECVFPVGAALAGEPGDRPSIKRGSHLRASQGFSAVQRVLLCIGL